MDKISDVTVANASERLERATFKLGRAQAKAIRSAAQANADRLELEACQKEADEARADLEGLVSKATAPVGSMEKAIEAVREKMAEVAPAVVSSVFTGGKAEGGRVVPGVAYKVGDHAGERVIPMPTTSRAVVLQEIEPAAEGDQPVPPADQPEPVQDVLGIAQPLGPRGPKIEILAGRPELTQGGPELREPMDWPSSIIPPPHDKCREGDRWFDSAFQARRVFMAGAWIPDPEETLAPKPKPYWPAGDQEQDLQYPAFRFGAHKKD